MSVDVLITAGHFLSSLRSAMRLVVDILLAAAVDNPPILFFFFFFCVVRSFLLVWTCHGSHSRKMEAGIQERQACQCCSSTKTGAWSIAAEAHGARPRSVHACQVGRNSPPCHIRLQARCTLTTRCERTCSSLSFFCIDQKFLFPVRLHLLSFVALLPSP